MSQTRPRWIPARHHGHEPRRQATSGSSGPDETESTVCPGCSRSRARHGRRRNSTRSGTPAQPRRARVMEVLSEHTCQGWLEGYLLTGRHGSSPATRPSSHRGPSMVNQYAKWLNTTRDIGWRRPISSLNYLLTSHVWRVRTTTGSRIRPGIHRPCVNKKPTSSGVSAAGHQHAAVDDGALSAQPRLHQRGRRGQAAGLDLLDAEQAEDALPGDRHLDWASPDGGGDPDGSPAPVMCPRWRRWRRRHSARHLPDLRVRVVNVVDLMRLVPHTEHPTGAAGRGVRRGCSPRTSRSSSTITVTLADPSPAPPYPAPDTTISMSVATGRRDDHDPLRHVCRERHRPLPPDRCDRPAWFGLRRARGRGCGGHGRPPDRTPASHPANVVRTFPRSGTGRGRSEKGRPVGPEGHSLVRGEGLLPPADVTRMYRRSTRRR